MKNMQSISISKFNVAYTAGLILILSVAICFVVAAFCFLADFGVSAYTLPLSFGLACLFAGYVNSCKNLIGGIFVAFVIWCLCAFICTELYDSSCDGNLYHMEIVANIYNGWNPYLHSTSITSDEPWAEHYAKAMEIVGACLMFVTQQIQSTKAVTMVLAVGTLLVLPELFRLLAPQISKKQSIILSLLVLSNPVVICQMLRFYIDDVVYLCVVLAVISGLLISINERNKAVSYTLMAVAIVMAAATKANALVYVVFAIICTMVGMCLFRNNSKCVFRFAIFCAITGVVTVVILCYHPYITNWITDGHPLYPLLGEGEVDIMTGSTPEGYLSRNRVINLAASIFSIGWPSVDQRIGGFLPAFIIMFPLSVSVIGYYAWKQQKFTLELYLLICLLTSCLFFEQSWWARYVPQLWLVVPLAAFCLMTAAHRTRASNIAVKALLILGISTGVICCFTTYLGALRYTIRADNFYAIVSRRPIKIKAHQPQSVRMLEEHHVEYVEFGPDEITDENKANIPDFIMFEDEWAKILSVEEMAELDSLLRLNNFYKFGATVRRVIGKDENIPFYNTTSAVD